METKKGILKILAKSCGIKLGNDMDTWLNPTAAAKIDVEKNYAEVKKLLGTEVTISFDDNGRYTSIQGTGVTSVKEVKKETNWDAKERRLNRSVAISYAKDLVIADKIKLDELVLTAEKIYIYIQNEN